MVFLNTGEADTTNHTHSYRTGKFLLKVFRSKQRVLFFFAATAPIWALAYLHETLRFTSVF
jgi:hypothetical protein